MTPVDPLACAVFVVLAFVPAGVVHSLWLRSPWASAWRIPLDGGRRWRGRRLLGDNKTWAGLMALPPAAGLTFSLLHLIACRFAPPWYGSIWPLSTAGFGLLGAWTGLGFMAGELPNSFLKRQFDVAPGAAPGHLPARLLCFLVDRLDSLLGAFVAQALVVEVSGWYAFWLLLVGPGLHWLFSAFLYLLGVKGRPS